MFKHFKELVNKTGGELEFPEACSGVIESTREMAAVGSIQRVPTDRSWKQPEREQPSVQEARQAGEQARKQVNKLTGRLADSMQSR